MLGNFLPKRKLYVRTLIQYVRTKLISACLHRSNPLSAKHTIVFEESDVFQKVTSSAPEEPLFFRQMSAMDKPTSPSERGHLLRTAFN